MDLAAGRNIVKLDFKRIMRSLDPRVSSRNRSGILVSRTPSSDSSFGADLVSVLFLNRDLFFHGGVTQTFLTFARHRPKERVRLQIASFMEPSPEIADNLSSLEVPRSILGDDLWRPIFRLRHLIRTTDTKVVVCGTFKAFVTATLATFLLPCRTVFWIPSIPFMQKFPKKILFRILACNSHLIFVSRAVANAHSYRWHRGESTVLYHGISNTTDLTGRRSKDSHLDWVLPSGSQVLGFVAEFTPWKHHNVAIEAFAKLSRSHPNLHLVLVGNGDYLDATMRHVQGTDYAARIHFLGARHDVRALYPVFDVYIHPAVGEGFGLAVAEAMLAARPVVVANAGALPEFVRDGHTGLLFEPNNHRDLASKIEVLLLDPDLRRELGDRSRQHCLQHFSPERFAEEMTTIIEQEADQVK